MKQRMYVLWVILILTMSISIPGGTHAAAAPPAAAPEATQPVCTPPLAQVPSANRAGYNELDGLAVLTANDQWAVGHYYTPTLGLVLPLIEHGVSGAWSQVAQAVTTTTGQLRAVAGTAANDVWAVGWMGRNYTTPLLEHWNGHTWTMVPSPTSGGPETLSALNGVVAVAPDDVWAVGSYSDSINAQYGVLILHWNGHQWSQVPGPATLDGGALNAIAAATANDLWAVGATTLTGSASPLILHWDGSQWSQVSTPSLVNGGLLAAVTARPGDIWAVGRSEGDSPTLILHSDGSTWTQVAAPAPAGQNVQFTGVVALTASDVWAVGTSSTQLPTSAVGTQPLVEHWNGHTWQITTAPVVNHGSVQAVAGSTVTGLWIAGTQDTPQTLVAHWTGSAWAIAATPNPGRAGNVLAAVSASGPNDLWAVGANEVYRDGSGGYIFTSLVEHWDGHAWATLLTPHATPLVTLENNLNSVVALTPTNVWAVGSVDDGIGGYGVLIDHWNGSTWQTVVSGDPEAAPQQLYGVAAVGANDMWTVGQQSTQVGGTQQTLVEHWNGSTWQMVPSPNVGTGNNVLRSVAVVAANDIWAAGYSDAASGAAGKVQKGAGPDLGETNQPLLLHWNGSTWSVVPAPAGAGGALDSVAAASAQDIWAVGYSGAYPTIRTLILHWDGTTWQQVTSPNPNPNIDLLTSVAVAGRDEVWAAGYSATGAFSKSLLLHWNGHTWTAVPSASPGQIDNQLIGLTTTGAHDVWAVGRTSNGAPAQTLIAHAGLFTDVHPTDYFYGPVNNLVSRGIVSGYGDCTFRPGATASRAQVAKMLVLAEGWTLVTPTHPHFSDVPATHPFYAYVETAYAHGILAGYSGGLFHPSTAVTRAQAGKMIVLARGWTLQSPSQGHFHDVPPSSAFYAYIETAYAHGILSGYGDGTFRPAATVTRGQLSKLIDLSE